MNELELDPDLILTVQALETQRVEFVLVGDVAEAIYNHGGFVSGVAIVPGGYGRNVERLMRALHELRAELGIAGRPDPRAVEWRRMDLRDIAPCSFMTTYADVDVNFRPAGTDGYRDLFQDADRCEIGRGVRPYVASPDDLERLRHGTTPKPVDPLPRLADQAQRAPIPAPAPPRAEMPAAIVPPDAGIEDDYDPGIWTEEEFRAIRSGRVRY